MSPEHPSFTVVIGDYPHTRPLKRGTIAPEGVHCDFVSVAPLYGAFARMVRQLEFDVCELALATYLQAREAGVPITLLPLVMIGGDHHRSLTRWPDGPAITPEQLPGRRVGVRSYGQTTGLWVRGVLQEEHGIAADDMTWVVTEATHVAQYRDPEYVERAAGPVSELLRKGDVAAAVLGPRAVETGTGGLVPVIPDAAAAGQRWIERHGTIPVNHVVVVRNDTLRAHPAAVSRLYQAMATAMAATARERDQTPRGRVVTAGWSDSLARCLEIAGGYALQQRLVRSRVDVAQIEKEAAVVRG
jgi:4,5-dihydroxyphthalate decarboxylase